MSSPGTAPRFDAVDLQRRDGVALLTLSRPEKLNALDARLVRELGEALERIEADESVGAVVVAGAGRSFCAGFDLDYDAALGPGDREAWRARLGGDFEFLMRFWDFPKPTVAAVQGHCLAGGFQLALCCDLALAADDAVFGAPELGFGSVVTALILPWIAGPRIAKEIILSADDDVSAERALAAGIVNRVVPRARLLDEALALASRMARMDPQSVRGTKAAINRSMELAGMKSGLREALEAAVALETLDTPSRRRFREMVARDGLRAALEWRERRLAGAPAPDDGPCA